MNISNIKKVFFYGIGGIGISAIARMMLQKGKIVVGQDTAEGQNIKLLRQSGAYITQGQSLDSIPKDTDVIVYSRAIEVLEPEFLKKIKALSIPSYVYPEMLGLVSKDMYTIAVSGCHGKTTTTGMVAHMLIENELDPTVIIGSFLQGSKSNFIQGESKYFVVEADEYHRAFLNLSPSILLITNIDLDHVDYYKDLADIQSAYRDLVKKVPKDGYIICDPDDINIKSVLSECTATVIDYKKSLTKRSLMIPGNHMQVDAALTFCVGQILSLEEKKVNQSLYTFPGTWRRFEFKGKTQEEAWVYDDYAHHPTEIKATLQAFREKYPFEEGYKLHIFFQPHLFSRTKALFNDFAPSFQGSDFVCILPIFKAREIDDGTMDNKKISLAIKESGIDSFPLSFQEAEQYLQKNTYSSKDIIITMGAGEAYVLGDMLLKR